MIVKVHEHKVEIIKTPVNEQEVNVTKCTFEFDETIPNNYVKKAFFTLNGNAYEQTIVNNECDIPNEVLSKKGSIELGVVAYKVENEELIQRFNPSPDYFDSWTGSLKEAQNTEPITPTDKEQIESAIAQLENDVEELDNTKQDTLVSGENIKTINNTSILGSGNINLNDTYYTKQEVYNKTEVDTIKTTIESEIPTKLSQLDNDEGYINKDVDDLTNYTKTSDLSEVATSGSYNDLEDTPNLSVYSLITETGAKIDLEINSSTYVLTAKLYDKNNNLLSTSAGIDLPLETMVVGASYDSETKEIILTLKNGQEVRFSVADLVSGLQTEITPSNKLASDLVDDTNQTHKFVSQSEKTQITTNATNIAGIKNGTTINSFSGVESALNTKEDKSNKVTSISSSSTDTQYPSAKCVYDSQSLQDNEISDLKSENDYLNSIINQLPKVSSQGTILTLNNTITGKMNIELGTSELEQETTTGKNMINPDGSGGYNGITVTNNGDGTFTVNGTSTGAVGVSISSSRPVLTANKTYTQVVQTISGTKAGQIVPSFKNSGGTITYNYFTDNESKTPSEEMTCNTYNYYLSTTGTQVNWTFRVMLCEGVDTTYEPYTGGIPAPNPSYPMPIHTISGSNKVVVCGKNLFDISNAQFQSNNTPKVQDDKIVASSPTAWSSIYFTFTGLSKNTTYYIKSKLAYTSGGGVFSQIFGGSALDQSKAIKTYMTSITTSGDYSTSFSTGDNDTITISFCSSGNSAVWNISNIMLSLNDIDYEPYVSQEANINLGDIEYCEIGDYKDKFVRSDGKNLFDKDNVNVLNAYIDSTNGNIGNDNNARTIYVPCKANTSYTISKIVSPRFIVGLTSTLPANGVTCLSVKRDDSATHLTLEGNANAKYLVIYLTNSYNSSTWNDIINSIMINEGSTALPYEPYGIGNWGIRKNINKILARVNSCALEGNGVRTGLDLENPIQPYPMLYCNYFGRASSYNEAINNDNNTPNLLGLNTNGVVLCNIQGYTTTDEYLNFFANNDVYIMYPLANSTYIPITGTLANQLETIYQYLLSYKGQTNISQVNNDLPFVISASALLDLNTLVGE